MISSSLTTLGGYENLKELEKRRPSIVREPSNSANPFESDPVTSGGKIQNINVRPPSADFEAPDSQSRRDRFEILESWEGVVTTVEEASFFASMRHTNSKVERAEDEFEIYMDNVAQGDRELVRSGAVFYLTVGIRHPRGEGPQKTTRLIFRRMPRWSSRDITRAEEATEELWKKINREHKTKSP